MSIWDLGQFELAILNITGNQMYDYFFTVICFFGLLSFAISTLIKVISRS